MMKVFVMRAFQRTLVRQNPSRPSDIWAQFSICFVVISLVQFFRPLIMLFDLLYHETSVISMSVEVELYMHISHFLPRIRTCQEEFYDHLISLYGSWTVWQCAD